MAGLLKTARLIGLTAPALLGADVLAQAAESGSLPSQAAGYPVITEVLYDVPSRELGGDANLDAMRSSVADEFVELMNPHDVPIDLTGFKIEDGLPQEQFRLVFTFPEFTLGPGEVVVVFNGARADEIPGDDGTPERAPKIRNPHFGDGWVFSMRQPQAIKVFDNQGDLIVVRAPDGQVVDAVWWGQPPMAPPKIERVAELPVDPQMSMQRLGPNERMQGHMDIDGTRFSPGRIPTARTDAAKKDDAPQDDTGE
jgi:hypothetical protein